MYGEGDGGKREKMFKVPENERERAGARGRGKKDWNRGKKRRWMR